MNLVIGRRLRRHSLLEPSTDPVAVVRAMCGAHAQVMSAAEVSIGLRTTLTRQQVRDAVWVDRTLVKTRGPRGTVHLLPAADLPMWTGALSRLPHRSRLLTEEQSDRDSFGLFQQRPSQGWGTIEQLMDPVFATNAFYDVLVTIDGYRDMEVNDAAQLFQSGLAGETEPLRQFGIDLSEFAIGAAFSRYGEHQADIFSLELTHLNEPMATAFRKLAENSKRDPSPHPLMKYWLYSHPPIAERIPFALSYRPWESPAK